MRGKRSLVGGRSVYTQILIAACVVLLPMAVALFHLTREVDRMRQATLAVKAASAAIDVGHRLELQFSELQMAVHAFALTGDDVFLIAYQRGRREWSEVEAAASGAILDDPERGDRFRRVDAAVLDFLDDWERRLETFEPGAVDPAARARIHADREQVRDISRNITAFVVKEEQGIDGLLAEEEVARQRVYWGAVATSAAALGLLALFAVLMGRSIARPIRRTAEAALSLGEGDLSRRVEASGSRETRVLAAAFNRMAEMVQEARESLDARNRQLEETAQRLALLNEDLKDRQNESDDFLYVLSHDLRAPLINIQGFTKRLDKSMSRLGVGAGVQAPSEETARELQRMEQSLKFIDAATAKIDQLIARLLEIARLTTRPSERQWIDMEAMAHDVVAACQFQLQEKGIEARVGSLPRVFGDPTQLNQVLTNLVDNAIKYMGERPLKEISITCSERGFRYRFAVRDTGPGISAENKEKVFRMFTRLAPNAAAGEGVGLTAVRAIVNKHGGRIWVESTEGVGSTFYFSLPRRPEGAPPLDDDDASGRELRPGSKGGGNC